MAIRMRRGSFGKFDPAKLLAGELAVVLDGDSAVADGKAMYVCFAAGDVKRVATWEDAAQLIAAQLPDVIDMAVTSGTEEALTVTAEADEGGKTVFEVSHVAKASDGAAGLDPFSQSAGERETLGTTTLVDGTTFWVPCVSVDRYGHVDGISYRRFAMPTTGVATLTRLGKVIPDGKTIEIDASGMISAKVPDGSIVFRGVVPMDEYLPADAKSGDLYISDGIAKMWDGDAKVWRVLGGDGDVLEYASRSAFPASGKSGKIYVALDTNLAYRWAGSSYTEISPSLALGETSSTAYRGDRGKAAYDHAQAHGAAFSSDLYKITTNAEGHVTAATPATSDDIVAFLNNQALTPASVTATGAVSGSTVSDSVGSLADLRDSVSPDKTVSIVQKPADATGGSLCYWKSRGVTVVAIDSLTFPTAGVKTLATLPEGYRPLHYIAAPTLRGGTGAYMEVSPNGVVRVSVSDASQWVFGTIAY